jgi:hypothetical protein
MQCANSLLRYFSRPRASQIGRLREHTWLRIPLGSPLSTIGMAQKLQHCPGRSPLGMREAMDLISLIGMAQSIQHCGHVNSECKLGFDKNAHAGRRTRVTSMEGLYDAATLHAPCQVHPFPCTLTGSFLNDHKVIVQDHGELQMHLLKQSDYGQAGIPECPGLLTPSRHKRCVQMAIRMQM